MDNKPVTLTENQLLELSALVSDRVTILLDIPVTESEDCVLALKIGEWLKETLGVRVVDPMTDPEGWSGEIPTTEGGYYLKHDGDPDEVSIINVWMTGEGVLMATTPNHGFRKVESLHKELTNPLWKEV